MSWLDAYMQSLEFVQESLIENDWQELMDYINFVHATAYHRRYHERRDMPAPGNWTWSFAIGLIFPGIHAARKLIG